MYSEEHLGQFVGTAHTIARSIEWSPDDHDDLVQEGLVALLKSMREYQRPGKVVDNPEALARSVMLRAMKWWYTPKDRNYTSCELKEDHLVAHPDDYAEAYIAEFLHALGEAHGAVARAVAAALVIPDGVVAELALAAAEAKAIRAAAGELLRGHSTIRLTHEHVRKALHLEESQWYKVLAQVRGFTRNYLRQSRSRI